MADTAETITTSELTPTDAQRWDARRKAYDVPTREEFAQFLERALERAESPDGAQFRARIVYDSDAQSPRENCNLGKITYKNSSRYCLGDTPVFDSELAELLDDRDVFFATVVAYVHSGATVRIGGSFKRGGKEGRAEFRDDADAPRGYPFSCQWDAGTSGIVYLRVSEFLKEHGRKNWTRDMADRAEKLLRGELEEFDNYLRGECYGIVIEKHENSEGIDGAEEWDADDSDAWEEVDSVYGFIGTEYAKTEARSMLFHALKTDLDNAEKSRKEETDRIGALLFGAD